MRPPLLRVRPFVGAALQGAPDSCENSLSPRMVTPQTVRRKNIRLTREQYRGRRFYFVTICCAHRRPFFVGSIRPQGFLQRLREAAAANAFAVRAYCLMPDHVHLLLEGLQPSSDLVVLVNHLKASTAFDEKQRSGQALWQRYFYDHVLRPGDSPEAVAGYIWMNPVRKGLCTRSEDYPFSGSFTDDWARWKRIERALWIPPWKSENPEGAA